MVESKLFGVILIGATSVDLQIVNRKSGNKIEKVHHDTILNDELYDVGVVAQDQIERVIVQLQGFQQLLRDYAVTDIRIWGAYSLASASNAVYVVAQIKQATGLKIEWLSASQEAYYGQLSMRYGESDLDLSVNNRLFLVSLSSGRLSLGYYETGDLKWTRSINLGPMRLASDLDTLVDEFIDIQGLTREFIHSKLADYTTLLPTFPPANLLVVSGSLALGQLLKTPIVSRDEFFKTNAHLLRAPIQKWSEKLNVTANQLPAVMPELLLLEELVAITQVDQVGVSEQHMLPGLVMDALGQLPGDEILAQAQELSQRFGVEPKHQQAVRHFSEQLFDRLKKVHGLGKRERILLQVAALVHDVGSYLNTYHHYEYSETVILAAEMEGLTPVENRMVAMISRYHSHAVPGDGLQTVKQLTESEWIVVVKLTAILRLADALDDSRLQKIEKIAVSTKAYQIVVTGYSLDKLYLEQSTFEAKANLFEDVFGRLIILKRKGHN
ncbi:exopolyphosphatase [Weissella diestrammenae]|uniref:Exopolyphosphatase n=1 Tax=Weissella diestrammenae TaxID=1162633 RepID=A0A7G9T3M2_9LACO|nr:exopolyphosphatase [Weissella diestrammenae]MCM0582674.1 exopolyphosphatase [Weissella diestrammenae]QNN74697.1 exopolyphosphatase [Weissella diestrammenae]